MQFVGVCVLMYMLYICVFDSPLEQDMQAGKNLH